MTPVELDFFKARVLAENKSLAIIVCGAPPEFIFEKAASCADGAPCAKGHRCPRCSLEETQRRFHEDRIAFQTSKHPEQVKRIAQNLPRMELQLRRASTGWRDRSGVLHRYAVYADPVICPHGKDLYVQDCETCAAADAETDAL